MHLESFRCIECLIKRYQALAFLNRGFFGIGSPEDKSVQSAIGILCEGQCHGTVVGPTVCEHSKHAYYGISNTIQSSLLVARISISMSDSTVTVDNCKSGC